MRLSGYLRFANTNLRWSHSVAKASRVDDRRKVRFTMVLISDFLYLLSTWLWWWSSRPVFVGLPALVNQQCVVYNYQCDLCDAEYVGYTSRHLHQRIDKHRSSAIGKHLKNDHGIKTIGDLNSNFSVLKKCGGKLDCLIYEMLFIKKKKPKLNTQSDSIRAKLFI